MELQEGPSDDAALEQLGRRLASHRLDRNVTQSALAREAGVSVRTVSRLEGGESTQLLNLVRVLRALGLLERLEALVPEPLESPIEELRRQRERRKRASSATRTPEPEPGDGWSWGDEQGAPEDAGPDGGAA